MWKWSGDLSIHHFGKCCDWALVKRGRAFCTWPAFQICLAIQKFFTLKSMHKASNSQSVIYLLRRILMSKYFWFGKALLNDGRLQNAPSRHIWPIFRWSNLYSHENSVVELHSHGPYPGKWGYWVIFLSNLRKSTLLPKKANLDTHCWSFPNRVEIQI